MSYEKNRNCPPARFIHTDYPCQQGSVDLCKKMMITNNLLQIKCLIFHFFHQSSVTRYLKWKIKSVDSPATLADEISKISEEPFDPSVRVVVAGSSLHDSLLPLQAAGPQKRVLAHFQEFQLKQKL